MSDRVGEPGFRHIDNVQQLALAAPFVITCVDRLKMIDTACCRMLFSVSTDEPRSDKIFGRVAYPWRERDRCRAHDPVRLDERIFSAVEPRRRRRNRGPKRSTSS